MSNMRALETTYSVSGEWNCVMHCYIFGDRARRRSKWIYWNGSTAGLVVSYNSTLSIRV